MHKTKLDRRYERLFGTLPTAPKPVKRRGRYWFTELSGRHCNHGSTTFHIKDEIDDWLNERTSEWHTFRTQDWDRPVQLKLFLPSLELMTEFRLVWSDSDHNS
jgi:hypothetical protein